MDAIPSPLERLLRLERAVDQLQCERALPGRDPEPPTDTPPLRHRWPADELLLLRLVRRSPQALAAYQGPAELTATGGRGLQLSEATTGSPFLFCELIDGDAVVWIAPGAPSWAWESSSFQQLFAGPTGVTAGTPLALQSLPVFKPVVRSRRWTLFRKGEMVPRLGEHPQQAEQGMLLRRLEALEQRLGREMVRRQNELGQLRAQLRVQQDLLERVLRVRGPGRDC